MELKIRNSLSQTTSIAVVVAHADNRSILSQPPTPTTNRKGIVIMAPLPSNKLTRLLLVYTLCYDAVHAQRLHTDFVKDTLFFAGVTAYYSALGPRDIDWLKIFLTEPDTSDLMDDETLQLRHNNPLNVRYDLRDTSEGLGDSLWNLFDKFKRIRNKDIAHRNSRGSGHDIERILLAGMMR